MIFALPLPASVPKVSQATLVQPGMMGVCQSVLIHRMSPFRGNLSGQMVVGSLQKKRARSSGFGRSGPDPGNPSIVR